MEFSSTEWLEGDRGAGDVLPRYWGTGSAPPWLGLLDQESTPDPKEPIQRLNQSLWFYVFGSGNWEMEQSSQAGAGRCCEPGLGSFSLYVCVQRPENQDSKEALPCRPVLLNQG